MRTENFHIDYPLNEQRVSSLTFVRKTKRVENVLELCFYAINLVDSIIIVFNV